MLIKLLLIENTLCTSQQAVSFLERLEHITVCGVATNYEQSIELINTHQPNIILLELSAITEQSFTLSSSIKERFPHIHIILYTCYDYVPYFNQLIAHGVSGMLYKNASPAELKQMLYTVLKGNTIIPLSLFAHIKLHRPEQLKSYWEIEMTPIERCLLEMLDKRCSNAHIAEKIHVSLSSVEKYLRKLYHKLGVRNRSQAIERLQRDRCLRPILINEMASAHLSNVNKEI